MNRTLELYTLSLCLLVTAGACGDDYQSKPTTEKGLIILGLDGLDPVLLRQYMAEGRTPNLKALAERGSFIELQTTDPPQSPVAWSAFITGLELDGHGIYDFVHRDPVHLEPYLSTSSKSDVKTFLGKCVGGGEAQLLREGRAFWQDMEDSQVAATMVKVPANFPPTSSRRNESMAGMGTPDLLGTYGTYQVFSSDPSLHQSSIKSGFLHRVDFAGGQVATSELIGPPACGETEPLTLDVEIKVGKRDPVALMKIGDSEVMLQPGEWSDWVPIAFDSGILSGDVPGMVRVYLRQLDPLHVYVSPINLDPLEPALPISEPPAFAEDMARHVGRFYTQGMAEDTKALSSGILTDEEFLAQAEIVLTERIAMLRGEMERYSGGLLFFYFSSSDQIAHVFYGSLMEDAPQEVRKYAHVVPEVYEKMDRIVGEVIDWAGDKPVVVMSDHGFAPYTWKVHLNTWLAEKGYLELMPPGKTGAGPLGHIDWESTQAYALGLNQLFINVEGREARGVVSEPERELVMRRLIRDLESWRNPETGERVVTKAIQPPAGQYADRAPDIIVGYNRSYRSSDDSAMGLVGERTIERNHDHWNGDHCMHASHVPGVLLTSMPLDIDQASLTDLAPTILNHFGVQRPETLEGNILWDAPAN